MRAHYIQRAHCMHMHMHMNARASHLYLHTRGCASLVSRGARNTLVTFPRGMTSFPWARAVMRLRGAKTPRIRRQNKPEERFAVSRPPIVCLCCLIYFMFYAGRESSINRELQVSTSSFWWTGYQKIEDGGLIDLFGTYVRNFVSLETDARMYNWITYGSLYLNEK